MPEVEPITREEKLWSGEDIEPITREEQYIKHIYDKTQKIPSKPITRKEMLLEKAGEGGGSDVTIKQLSVTANGTYSEENTAYSPVIVNVPKTPLSKLTVTENGTYTAPTGTGYDEVAVDVPLPSNAYLLKEVEGLPKDIATFTDGSNLPMPSLKTTIVPIQDLHGYDSPWVGGGGKNKLENKLTTRTYNGVTATVKDDGTIVLTGTATQATNFFLNTDLNLQGDYTINGCPSGGSDSTYYINAYVNGAWGRIDNGNGITVNNATITNIAITVANGYAFPSGGLTFKPMIRLASVQDATFAPYSNICPISGWDEVNVTVADDVDNPTVENIYTIDLDGTHYGGTLDVVNGVLTVDRGYIASYNGETLPSTWISDRDVYAEGTTPTIGAEVVYELATPQTIQLTPTAIKSLQGINNVFADTGDILEGKYWSKNPVTVTRAMLNTLRDAGEITPTEEPEEPEENDER